MCRAGAPFRPSPARRCRRESRGRLPKRRAVEVPGQRRPHLRAFERLAFPYDEHVPTQRPQFPDSPPVSLDVLAELVLPLGDTGPRCRRPWAAGVPMPEAPVDQDHLAEPREDEIGRTRQVPSVKPEAVAQGVCRSTND